VVEALVVALVVEALVVALVVEALVVALVVTLEKLMVRPMYKGPEAVL